MKQIQNLQEGEDASSYVSRLYNENEISQIKRFSDQAKLESYCRKFVNEG